MIEIELFSHVGSFAENKDAGRSLRLESIVPALERGEKVTLNFEKVDSATQSFVHALISDLFRKYGADVLDRVFFKNCNQNIQKIITIVVEYMQEAE